VKYLSSQTTATELAKLTKIKKSTVDHWFRRDDKGFSYPSLEDWSKIKPHLTEIKYDKELTTVEVIEWSSAKESWSTPRASQATKPVNKKAPSAASGSHGSTLEMDVGERNPELIGQRLNPEWVNRLMGFPDGWLN